MAAATVVDTGVVIVTHEPTPILVEVVDRLLSGRATPAEVVVVDSGSTDRSALSTLQRLHPTVAIRSEPTNVGFCVANNLGAGAMRSAHRFLLFLNPDALVSEGFLHDGVALLEAEPSIGALNPKLLKVDAATGQPTGAIDCAGIFQTRYGRIYDRGQAEIDRGQYDGPPEDVPALCAAAMLCRVEALRDVAPDGQIFDESFFMFKEDVDLSYRLRVAGWRTVLASELVVHHLRGYEQQARSSIPAWVRRRSVANEWRLWRKPSLPRRLRVPMLGYLAVKSIAVRLGR